MLVKFDRRFVVPVLAAMTLLAGLVLPRETAACPFCSAPSLTLSEQYFKADAVVLVSWKGGEKPKKGKLGSTEYEVLDVLRDPSKRLKKGEPVHVERYREGKSGDRALLLGTQGDTLEWSPPLEVNDTSLAYISQAPSLEAAPAERLTYYMKFLEYSDQEIANDAYAEFANAPYKDITPLASKFPRDKLRKWVTSKETSPTRLGLYGLMLGLCGDASDAELLEQVLSQNPDEFRLGIDGVIGGYLLLKGEAGLDVVEKAKLKAEKVEFSETYAAVQAIRFMWTYGDGKIPPERLRGALRILLGRPSIADLIIGDLMRWKDWSIQDRLMELYANGDYDVPSIKRAIIRYMLTASKDVGEAKSGPKPMHAVRGAEYLDVLRQKDKKAVEEVERFYVN